MIPIRDEIKPRHFPWINWILILANVAAFIYEIRLPQESAETFFRTYGMIPANFTLQESIDQALQGNWKYFLPFFSNMFLHGGWGHLIGNIWTLHIFGDNVENAMGKIRYLLFYLLCGILATSTHYFLNRHSIVPVIGASGAISGVMAAYLFLYPRGKILFLIPIFYILPLFIPLPAFIYLIFWFIGQLYGATASLMLSHDVSEIAFWAHVGGFIGGIIIYGFFVSKKRLKHTSGLQFP
ncbi:MAG: rhomboid family intramembrane serine protease [Bacteroidales bacterium]|nr:rhomboid family intramembrane serine protease [Bacteroidales bacterium]